MRRSLLLLALAAGLRADSARDAWDVLSRAAAALTAGNAAGFLACFDPKMPAYGRLRADVTALVREAEPGSSIEQLENQGDDRVRTLKVDWLLNLVSRQDGVTSTRRQTTLQFRVEKQGSRWWITHWEPEGFFAPPV